VWVPESRPWWRSRRIPSWSPFRQGVRPISQVCLSYLVLAVKPDFLANDLKEFVAVVKANPGKYNLGSFGTGTTSHILGERFARVAELDMTHVPCKASAPMLPNESNFRELGYPTPGNRSPSALISSSTEAC
jgi:hypothetical protein